MKIIATTGTKGKTSVTRIIAGILHAAGKNTLRVDSDGHYVNEKQKSLAKDSRHLFGGKGPSVVPGKYLIEMKKYYPDFFAVLECSYSCRTYGLGYDKHDIGIFTNVFEDHLYSSNDLKKSDDLAKAKSFIFRAINQGGYAVFNADDKYVCSQLGEIPRDKGITLVPIGIDLRHLKGTKGFKNDFTAITLEGDFVVVKSKNQVKKVINYKKISWTFEGKYTPSLYNLMLVVGALYGVYKGSIPQKVLKLLSEYKFDDKGGRLNYFENSEGIKIIVDYAHEKHSLTELAKLGHKIKNNRLIGVIRLAPNKTDVYIKDVGKAVANSFDSVIVYDKIDGTTRGRFVARFSDIVREIGDVSNILYKEIKKHKKDRLVERIVAEKDAVKRAAQMAKKGDTVIIIFGNDQKKTIGYVKDYFKVKPKGDSN